MITPYKNPKTQFSAGVVLAYNPNTNSYLVNLDLHGSKTLRAVQSGVNKPYVKGTRVVAALVTGAEWLIIGEVPRPADAPEQAADSDIESIAKARGRASISNEDVNWRNRDISGVPDVPVFEGDARVETRGPKNIAKAFIHLFRYGDIIMRASALCFVHLARKKNTIFIRARNLRAAFLATSRNAVTDNEGLCRTTDKYWSAASAVPSVEEYRGYVATPGIAMANGSRQLVGALNPVTTEIDADTGTLRISNGANHLLLGSMVSENTTHPITGVRNPAIPATGVDNGFVILVGSNAIRVADSFISIDTGVGNVAITPELLTFTLGSQKFSLGSDGFIVDANNVTIRAATNMTLESPSIDFKT